MLDIAIKIGTVGLLLVALAFPAWPQFQGKAFLGRAFGYPIALTVVPAAWWIFGRGRVPFPVAVDILLGLPFLIDMAGNAANLYDSVDWWDDANHLVNWGIHTAALGLLLRGTRLAVPTRLAIAVGWASTSAVLWELVEYVAFVPGSPEAASAYADTLGDLALGLLGGTVAAVFTAWWPRSDRHDARVATVPESPH